VCVLVGDRSGQSWVSLVSSSCLWLESGSRTDWLTELAWVRRLDIKGIENVVNYEMPRSIEIYLHRVGRTARAGKQGR
jgi:hypothetical protein